MRTKTRFYRQLSQAKELRAIFKYAKRTCNTEMKNCLNDACDKAVDAAKVVAPVYDPAVWLGWWAFEHHYTPPGTLKESIRHSRASCQARGASYRIQFRADAPFADEQENGFKHHMSGKIVFGRYYMRSAYNQVFVPTWHMKMREATERMFAGKPM